MMAIAWTQVHRSYWRACGWLSLACLAAGTACAPQSTVPPNSAPAVQIGEVESVRKGEVLSLSAAESADADGDDLTYAWEQVSGPEVSFSCTDCVETDFLIPSGHESYVFRVTVSDGTDSASSTVTVASLNTPPFAEAGANRSGAVGVRAELSASGSFDADDDPLTYTWTQLSGTSAALESPGSSSCGYTLAEAGESYEFQLTVSDGYESATDTAVVTVTGEDAGDAPVSFGLLPSEEDAPDSIFALPGAAGAALPADFRLDTEMPGIGSQGGQGSCVGWSTGYGLASYLANEAFGWGYNSDAHLASPAYVYAKAREVHNGDCQNGTYINYALDVLVRDGCSSLQTQPYSDQTCPLDPSAADAGNFRIVNYHALDPRGRDDIKSWLSQGYPVVVGITVYDNFMYLSGTSTYSSLSGEVKGGHAILVVGYDDSRNAYRLMNSWGTGWGDSGFAWVDYATFEDMTSQAYVATGGTTPTPPLDPDDPDLPDDPPPPSSDPVVTLTNAYQYYYYDYYYYIPYVYVIVEFQSDQSIYVEQVTLTDPYGTSCTLPYNAWAYDGYAYCVRWDGYQWASGTYTCSLDVITQSGEYLTYTGNQEVGPLDYGTPKVRQPGLTSQRAAKAMSLIPSRGFDEHVLGPRRRPVVLNRP